MGETLGGRELHVAVEACTGWLFVCDALVASGAVAHLAEPVETRALRGRKRRAKTDREDARWLRELLAEGRLPELKDLAVWPMSSSARNLQPACLGAGETSGAPSQMSIPPPGYQTPQASPPPSPPPAPQGAPLSHEDAKGQNGSRQVDDNVQYEFKSVQALRGRESSAKAKWQDQGWEFVSENRGTLRTELNFRRVKPKTFGATS